MLTYICAGRFHYLSDIDARSSRFKIIMEYIQAKSILSRLEDNFFGLTYNMNLYRGCQHGCIYCDSRSACYQMDDLSKIYVKQNAIDLLRKELPGKRKRGTIGFGSMNDPYMPIEKKELLTRQALEVIHHHRFPIHIITKSDLVARDLDLIAEIGKIYSAVSFSFSTFNDSVAQKTEPGASSPSKRLKAMEKLSNAGIYTGVALMPVLPFINDNEKRLKAGINSAADAGAKYILPYFGVTLREGSREYFFEQLEKLNPEIKTKYAQEFGLAYYCNSPKAQALYEMVQSECDRYGIHLKMNVFSENDDTQLSLF